jgi:hypothetical protein
MTHIQAKIHASLETKSSYQQAAAEGFAKSHKLTASERLDRLAVRYRIAREAGRMQAAAAIKRSAQRIAKELH